MYMSRLRFCEQFWTTATGEKIPFSEVTHSHWSNIYWYHRYIVDEIVTGKDEDYGVLADFAHDKKAHCNRMAEVAMEQLNLRFDGILLDWEPKYENEKLWYITQKRKVLIEKHVQK